MTPTEKVAEIAMDAVESMVNQDERPFTAEERAQLNQALVHLRSHLKQVVALGNATLAIATLAGFLTGVIFAKLT